MGCLRSSIQCIFLLLLITLVHSSKSDSKNSGQLRVKTISNIRPTEPPDEGIQVEDEDDEEEDESVIDEDVWEKIFPDSPAINKSTLLPKSVYDFQTGKPFFMYACESINLA